MFFEQKKIKIETLGEYLKEARSSLNLSLEEIAKKADIYKNFLEFLESGNFNQLPADVYVFGFLKKLAKLYLVEPDLLIEQYKKEKCIQGQISKRVKFSDSPFKKALAKIVVTPKFISFFFGAIFVLATIGYIVWQVFSINRMPNLQIFEPQDKQAIKTSSVLIKGRTDPGMSVAVNGQNVFVDSSGNFQTQIGVSAGPKDIEIIAKNKFDKSISKKISIVGEAQSAKLPDSVELRIDALEYVVIKFAVDDHPSEEIAINKNSSKILNAEKKIIISTTNAGATLVTVNGKSLGVLGRVGEKLENIPFSAESGNINK